MSNTNKRAALEAILKNHRKNIFKMRDDFDRMYLSNDDIFRLADKEAVNQLTTLLKQADREARIDERDYAWKMINDLRYQRISLDFAKEVTLERLSKLQVEQQLANELEKHTT